MEPDLELDSAAAYSNGSGGVGNASKLPADGADASATPRDVAGAPDSGEQAGDDTSGVDVVKGRALFCLGEDLPIRHTLNSFLNRKETEAFLLLCILLNVVILAIQSPTNSLSEADNDLMNIVDHVLSAIFSIEMIGRIVALGFVMEKTAYLRNPWYVLDFVVVFSIWVGWTLELLGDSKEGGEADVSYLRTMRALRPLRSLRMFPYVKLIMSSMYDSISMFVNVTLILAGIMVLLTAIGLQVFAGATNRVCARNSSALGNFSVLLNGSVVTSKDSFVVTPCPRTMESTCGSDCNELMHEFTGDLPDEIHSFGFDNVRNSMITLFIVATLDEWPQLADPLRSSDLDASWLVWTYYVTCVLFGGMLGINLFVAVVTVAFGQARAKEEKQKESAKTQTDEPAPALMPADSVDTFEAEPNSEESVSAASTAELKPVPFIPGLSPILRDIAKSDIFDSFILTIVVLNTGALAAEHHRMEEDFRHDLETIEHIFLVIYCVEVLIKNFGLGFKEYFSQPFNVLDFSIVLSSLASLAFKSLKGTGAVRMLRILRLFRAARLIRVLKRYEAVMDLINAVTESYSALLNVCLFITIWMVIFAVMALHLYGFDAPAFDEHGLPRENFHNFWRSLLTCFVVLTGEDWSPLMYAYVNAFGWNAAVFFVFIFVVTNFVLINLFVAVIVDNFELDEDQKREYQKTQYQKQMRLQGIDVPESPTEENDGYEDALDNPLFENDSKERFAETERRRSQRRGGDNAEVGHQPDNFYRDLCCPDEDLHYCQDTCFLRALCIQLVEHPLFDQFIIVIIILSSIALGIEGPEDAVYLADLPKVRTALEVADVIFFFIFWVECVAKVIAMGFLFTNGAYLRQGWNQLDFSVVMLTTVDFIFRYCASCSGNYSWIKVFRVARVLRPLRVASKFDNIRVIVSALMDAMGGVLATLFLAFFFFMVFGILALSLFAGKLYFCEDPSGEQELREALNMVECLQQGYVWRNPDQHFDNIWYALECLFVSATLEGWVEIMNNCMDITDVDMAPSQNNRPGHAVFFVLFTIFGSFFISNLFIGVLVNSFQQSTGTAIYTDAQQKWVRFQNLLLVASVSKTEKQKQREVDAATGLQKQVLPWINSERFETCICVLIILNVILLLCESFPQDSNMTTFIDMMNIVFLVIFTIETILQLLGRGLKAYFKNNWLVMDFCVVLASWVTVVFDVKAGIQALRAFRLLRLLLIFKWAKMIRSIIMTIIVSIVPAANVGAALLLLLCVGRFSIVCSARLSESIEKFVPCLPCAACIIYAVSSRLVHTSQVHLLGGRHAVLRKPRELR
jgi:hypothetical protein